MLTGNRRKPRALLTSTFRPWGTDDLYNTPEMTFDGLAGNFIRHQEPFVPHGLNTLPATHFIAHNLKSPCVVIDHPSLEEFEREVAAGQYEFIGISFMTCEFPKARKMVEVALRAAPKSKVILGGYGVDTPGVEDFGAHAICRGEGVEFFRKLLGEETAEPLRNPMIRAMPRSRFFGLVPVHLMSSLYWYTTGLGCRMGCEFCVTSNYWGKNYIPLIRGGEQIFEEMTSTAEASSGRTLFAVNQDDFLMEKARNLELWERARESDRKPYGFMCFSSAKAASMYTPRQLMEMGLEVLFLGVETSRPKSPYGEVFNSRKHVPAAGGRPVDFRTVFGNLRAHGIKTVAACITAVPGHTLKTQQADIGKALDFGATMYQFSSYTPFPGTPLWKSLREKGLMVYDCATKGFEPGWWKNYDGITLVYKHPHLSEKQAKELPDRAWKEEYRRYGPAMLRMLECDLTAWEVFRKEADTPRMKRILEDKAGAIKAARPLVTAMLRKDLGLSVPAIAKADELLEKIEKRFGRMGRFERALAGEIGEVASSYYARFLKGDLDAFQERTRTNYPVENTGVLRSAFTGGARRAAENAPGFNRVSRALNTVPEPILRAAFKGATMGLRAAGKIPGNPLGV